MFSDESESQARRKTFSILQDHMRDVLESARELSQVYSSSIENNADGVRKSSDAINKIDESVESHRRLLTREISDIGAMIINRADILHAAHKIDELSSYIIRISFRLSQLNIKILNKTGLTDGLGDILDMAVEGIHRLNEIVRALTINPHHAIDLSNSVQKVKRSTDLKFKELITIAFNDVDSVKDTLIITAILEDIYELADRYVIATNAITILALGL